MNWKKLLIWAVLIDFVAFTGYVLWNTGLGGLFEPLVTTLAGGQVFVDLVLALALVVVWMVRDAKRTGRNALPFVLLTLGTGSIGPLLYLATRKEAEAPALATAAAPA